MQSQPQPLIKISLIKRHPDYVYRQLINTEDLQKSMSGPFGLLQPIGIDQNDFLLYGLRRMTAASILGWEEIPYVRHYPANLLEALDIIARENEDRSNWTVLERAELAMKREAELRAMAKANQGAHKVVPPEEKIRTVADAAESVGWSRTTYEKVQTVMEAAEDNPQLAPIVEEMNKTGRVNGAYEKVMKATGQRNGKPRGTGPKIKKDIPLDAIGYPIPAKALEAHSDAQEIDAFCRVLGEGAKMVERVQQGSHNKCVHESVAQTIEVVKRNLSNQKLTHVCPYCKGVGKCDGCKDRGMVMSSVFASSAKAKQDAMKEEAKELKKQRAAQ